MLRLIQFLIFGHIHKWREVHRRGYRQMWDDEVAATGTRVECVCEKCGAHRKFDLI